MSIVGQPNRNMKGLRPPWRPGESGNARGKLASHREVLRLARANSPDAMRTLIKCMNDADAPWPARVAAANALLDRAWGKPKEHVEIDGAERVTAITLNIVAAQDDPSRVIGADASGSTGPPGIITITAARPDRE